MLALRRNIEGPVLRVLVLGPGSRDHEFSIEAVSGSQFFFADLVANGTGDTIFGSYGILLVWIEREMCEDFALLPLKFGLIARDRHMTDGAFVLDVGNDFGMVHGFAPHAGLPVRIPRRIRHDARTPGEPDGNVVTVRGREFVVTGETAV